VAQTRRSLKERTVSLDQEIVDLIRQVHTAADYLKEAVDKIGASTSGSQIKPEPLQLVCRQADPGWKPSGAATPDGGATGDASEDLKDLSNDIADTFHYVSQRLMEIAVLNSVTDLSSPPEPQLVCRRTT
jgi:hypothetical protein